VERLPVSKEEAIHEITLKHMFQSWIERGSFLIAKAPWEHVQNELLSTGKLDVDRILEL